MTEKASLQLKNLIKLAMQQYFQQSGINQILLSLFKAANQPQPQTTRSTSDTRIQNIISKNRQAINRPKSKIQSLKQSSPDQYEFSYNNEKTPMLNALQNFVEQPQMSSRVSSTVIANQNFDSLAMGVSILDTKMPDFLQKGINKLVKKN